MTDDGMDAVADAINAMTDELRGIKRLFVLLHLKLGATSGEIGTALGVDSSVVRRMIPTKAVKKLEFVE